jgi:hypothetical protein
VGSEEPSKCKVSQSLLITKYSGGSITNNKVDEASVMDMRQETIYVILLRKCEGQRQLGRAKHG